MKAYCTKCRRSYEVPWPAPPYSLRHHGDDRDTNPDPEHSHPVTGQQVPRLVPANPDGLPLL